MSLRARLVAIAAVGFVIQAAGSMIVIGGEMRGLGVVIGGSIFIGFALGFDRAIATVTGRRKSRR